MSLIDFPITSPAPFKSMARRAAHRIPDDHGQIRLQPASVGYLVVIDRHPWGEAHWILRKTRYLTAWRHRRDDDVVREFDVLKVVVHDPARIHHTERIGSRLREALPKGRRDARPSAPGRRSGPLPSAAPSRPAPWRRWRHQP